MQLPSSDDIEAMARLAAEMSAATPDERVAAAIGKGLLKDLAGNFDMRLPAGDRMCRERRIESLSEVLELHESAARAMGYAPADGEDTPALPELRLRDCRIDESDLSSVEVLHPLRLERCVWTCPATMIGTHFAHAARFVAGTFQKDANFFAATFAAEAFFGGVHFCGPADFRGATFHGEANLFRANFDESLELRFAHFEEQATLNVLELHFRGSSVLAGGLSIGSEQLRIGRWPRYRGRITGESDSNRHGLEHACEQYGELQANFAAQGSPDAEIGRDWCHYRYMDLHRRTQFAKTNPRYWVDWFFLKWCFGYGLYTRRILITGLAVILAFGLLFATNGFGLSHETWSVAYALDADATNITDGPWWLSLGNSLYFSVVTFATVGYGDWHPLHWARMAAAFEGLLGVFIMSVFTVSFARKILR